ncbi:hypothetical protein ACMD2_02282 [Ananas comosus]|uniref:RRM domain-containing protein n=1 Tax=Ananas comosus TaxID=4615 RepID=A0A199V510_ANACO|nr:hypothetical protein ACMD2_02282 [Ananas comosus]
MYGWICLITWIDGSDSSVCYVAYLIIYKVFYPAGYFFLYRTPIAIWRTSILGFWNGGMWTMAAGRFRSQVSRGFLNRREFSSEIFVSTRLIRDARTQRPKGYGFVLYASEAEAQKAIKAMDGRCLVELRMSVRFLKRQNMIAIVCLEIPILQSR